MTVPGRVRGIAAVMCAVALAGCGGGDRGGRSASGAPSSTSTVPVTTSTTRAAPSTVSAGDDGDLVAFCTDVGPILRFDDTAVPGRPFLDAASQAAVARLATSAPAELRPQVEVWRRAFAEAKDLVVGDPDDRRAFIASMADAEFMAATRAISEFDEQHCRR